MTFWAHSAKDADSEGQPLRAHLEAVAKLSASFFEDPQLKQLAETLGRYHDAGKYKPEVQRHILLGTNEHIDHSTLGAQLLAKRCGRKGIIPLYAQPILGHHGGMPDGVGGADGGQKRSMEQRLLDDLPSGAERDFYHDTGTTEDPLPVPKLPFRPDKTVGMQLYLTMRLLHAALVDADFLDTERYYDPDQFALRGKRPVLSALPPRYSRHMRGLQSDKHGGITDIRAGIWRDCIAAADGPQGIYALSVPTGGGKTLSSLGFALHHAQKHPNIRRVIYAIPFTSIIEQNADVFRSVLGEDAVLEHHSAMLPPETGARTDRAAENWDAPVVVTTNVQLFESIFSNRPSKSRKLHNLQDTVIILDEMQALPDHLLRPCLAALDALVKVCRATVVICTATQPDYSSVWAEHPEVREIIPDPAALHEQMRRTHTVYAGPLSDDALAGRLLKEDQVLCIVNSRKQAQELALRLGGEAQGAYHLSTMMCPRHRSEKLAEIRRRLDAGNICRVVSTSLIEAGVDVDFPVVYRAAAGLDSIAQAAGRCNRNGRLDNAPVVVFEPQGWHIPVGTARLAAMTMGEVAPRYDDLLCPAALKDYFALRFHAGTDLDEPGILKKIDDYKGSLKFPFATIAHDFEMIRSAAETVFIPYDETARSLLAQLPYTEAPGSLLRRLQRYAVNIYPDQKRELNGNGYLKNLDGILILDVPDKQLEALYSPEYGLRVSESQVNLFI